MTELLPAPFPATVQTASGAPVAGAHGVGTICEALDGHFFICTAAGTPGTWVEAGTGTYAALAGANFTGPLTIVQGAAATVALSTKVTGDTQNRWQVAEDGTQSWGDGTSAVDVALSRPGAAILAVSTKLAVASAPTTLGTVEKLRVNTPTTVSNVANAMFGASATNAIPLMSQGVAGQTGHIIAAQTSAGTNVFVVQKDGQISTADGLAHNLGAGSSLVIGAITSTNITVGDTYNLIFSATTGTKIGTATTQKLALWNATPNVQPTTAIAASTFVANTSLIANDSATFGGYTIGQVVAALKRIGALA